MDIELTVQESPVQIQVTIQEQVLNVTEEVITVNVNRNGLSSIAEIPDVFVAALQDGDTLQYDGTEQLWRNAPPAAVTGNIDGGTFY